MTRISLLRPNSIELQEDRGFVLEAWWGTDTVEFAHLSLHGRMWLKILHSQRTIFKGLMPNLSR